MGNTINRYKGVDFLKGVASVRNYIKNPLADESTNNWNLYSDNQTATFTNGSANIGLPNVTGLYVGMPVIFTSSGTLPTNFTSGTTYFIVSIVSLNIQVSATSGGTAISAGSAGTGTQTFKPLVPATGTGGSVTGLTFSRSTSSPLRGDAQFSLVQSNTTIVAGQGVSYDFTIDSADQAKNLTVSFDYNASATFATSSGQTGSDSDLEVFILDKTNLILIPVSPKVITAKGTNNFTFGGKFQSSSNSTSYRLIIHSATNSANATGWTVLFDNASVSPQTVIQTGAPVTDWVAYTPTYSAGFGTVTNNIAYWRRVGDSIELSLNATTGTVAASLATVTLPSGLSIDTSKLNSNFNTEVGYGNTGGSSTIQHTLLAVLANATTLSFGNESATTSGLVAQNGSAVFSSTTNFSFFGKLPIAGWSSNLQLSQDTDNRIVAASLAITSNVAATGGSPLKYDTTLFDTHGSYSASTGLYTVPVAGKYNVEVMGFVSSSTTNVVIAINGTQKSFIATATATQFNAGAAILNLNAGDTISIIPLNSLTFSGLSSGLFQNTWNINRIAGPTTIVQTESVNARYFASSTSISGSLATISWTTKDYDSHNQMSSGVYTIPVSGKYQINVALALTAASAAAGNAVDLQIQKNGVAVSELAPVYQSTQVGLPLVLTDEINCLAGDLIKVQVSSAATTPAIVSSNTKNYISINRVGN